MHQERNRNGQGQERQVYGGRVAAQQAHLIQLQIDAGVDGNAAENQVHVRADGRGHKDQDCYEHPLQHRAGLFPQGLEEGPSDQIHIQHQQRDAQVHQQDGAQRVEQGTVGVQQGREQLGGGAESAPVQVHAGEGTGLQQHGDAQGGERGMGHQKKHQAHDKQPQGYPQQGGMPLAAFREGFCGELEKRRAADRHRCPGAFRERPDGVVLVGPEVPVDAVERAGLQLVHNLQAGDDGAAVPLHLLFQIPFGPVVHVMELRRGVF